MDGANHEHSSYSHASPRFGFECHLYDETDPKFTTPYEWKYYREMQIGETYEVHWPHSRAEACGTPMLHLLAISRLLSEKL